MLGGHGSTEKSYEKTFDVRNGRAAEKEGVATVPD